MADFGLSLSLNCDKSHISGIRHGTPLYIAPEVLANSKVSKAADLYSFGVILWELYHGTLAWEHLMEVSGNVPRKAPYAAFYRGLFSYDDGGPMPAYVALGRACLSEDPLARPNFEGVLEAIAAMQAALETSPIVTPSGPQVWNKCVGFINSAKIEFPLMLPFLESYPMNPCLTQQPPQATLDLDDRSLVELRRQAAPMHGRDGLPLTVQERIGGDAHGNVLVCKGRLGDVDVAVKAKLLASSPEDIEEVKARLEAICSGSLAHPNLVRTDQTVLTVVDSGNCLHEPLLCVCVSFR